MSSPSKRQRGTRQRSPRSFQTKTYQTANPTSDSLSYSSNTLARLYFATDERHTSYSPSSLDVDLAVLALGGLVRQAYETASGSQPLNDDASRLLDEQLNIAATRMKSGQIVDCLVSCTTANGLNFFGCQVVPMRREVTEASVHLVFLDQFGRLGGAL